MKADRNFEPHLLLRKTVLPAGGEWTPNSAGWLIMQLSEGIGYWLHARGNQDLTTGCVLLLSPQVRGTVRISQLGPASFDYFAVQPERLTGLATLSEQHFLQRSAGQERFAFRFFEPAHPVPERFKTIASGRGGSALHLRLQLLDIFVQNFTGELGAHPSAGEHRGADARARLEELLRRTPASELVDLDFSRLVTEMGCTPRHLSRVFHAVVGMSFREKQTEVRLMRARELLATTSAKVLEVALESGYESLSLFNLMFKRRFGLSPGKWREQLQSRQFSRRRSPPRQPAAAVEPWQPL